jgi:hypothetical protein
MVTLDRIRLIGLLKKSPALAGLFHLGEETTADEIGREGGAPDGH